MKNEITILRKINSLDESIAWCQKEKKRLQDECPHNTERVRFGVSDRYPSYVEITHMSDTGNYDPSEDMYWTNCKCSLCNAVWTVEGSM